MIVCFIGICDAATAVPSKQINATRIFGGKVDASLIRNIIIPIIKIIIMGIFKAAK
jgi:hypothetical protein